MGLNIDFQFLLRIACYSYHLDEYTGVPWLFRLVSFCMVLSLENNNSSISLFLCREEYFFANLVFIERAKHISSSLDVCLKLRKYLKRVSFFNKSKLDMQSRKEISLQFMNVVGFWRGHGISIKEILIIFWLFSFFTLVSFYNIREIFDTLFKSEDGYESFFYAINPENYLHFSRVSK